VLEFVVSEADGTPQVHVETSGDKYPLLYNGDTDLLKGAVNRLHAFSDEFRSKHAALGVRIAT